MFTKQEKAVILESIKFDMVQRGMSLLEGANAPYVARIVNNPAIMLETYFADVNVLQEANDSVGKTMFSIGQGIVGLIKALVAVATSIGIGHYYKTLMVDSTSLLNQAKDALNAVIDQMKHTQAVAADAIHGVGDPAMAVGADTASAGSMPTLVVPGASQATYTKAALAGKTGLAAKFAATKAAIAAKFAAIKASVLSKMAAFLTPILVKFKMIFVGICTKIGISSAAASAMAPFAAAVLTVAGAIITYKLCKMLVSFIKNQVSKKKSGASKEQINAAAASMAAASVKMQAQAVSKITNKNKKMKAMATLKRKQAKLKALRAR